ncbi:AP2 domain transcription factor AP2IV-5 [Besnoitia besnoiti]|uniref:AP2 domain transcription factor AP2IV-5 n=1 Tax=Besnoitia besnoiti TaxID=94643 RepID=A0A2A9M1I7_BESBE|nr:AP2 domain transcription factor AP2IV-5 [Besnoitia besnoiti]PFH32358.1 AP2 domain transcription factor AP2IV-5 [Besnoitia besnoiti]
MRHTRDRTPHVLENQPSFLSKLKNTHPQTAPPAGEQEDLRTAHVALAGSSAREDSRISGDTRELETVVAAGPRVQLKQDRQEPRVGGSEATLTSLETCNICATGSEQRVPDILSSSSSPVVPREADVRLAVCDAGAGTALRSSSPSLSTSRYWSCSESHEGEARPPAVDSRSATSIRSDSRESYGTSQGGRNTGESPDSTATSALSSRSATLDSGVRQGGLKSEPDGEDAHARSFASPVPQKLTRGRASGVQSSSSETTDTARASEGHAEHREGGYPPRAASPFAWPAAVRSLHVPPKAAVDETAGDRQEVSGFPASKKEAETCVRLREGLTKEDETRQHGEVSTAASGRSRGSGDEDAFPTEAGLSLALSPRRLKNSERQETPKGGNRKPSESEQEQLEKLRQLALDLLFAVSFLRPFGRASPASPSVKRQPSHLTKPRVAPLPSDSASPSPSSSVRSPRAFDSPPPASLSASSLSPEKNANKAGGVRSERAQRKEVHLALPLRQAYPQYTFHIELVKSATSLKDLTQFLRVCFGPLLDRLHLHVEDSRAAAAAGLRRREKAPNRAPPENREGGIDDAGRKAKHDQQAQQEDTPLAGVAATEAAESLVAQGQADSSEKPLSAGEAGVAVPGQLASLLTDKLRGIGAILQILTDSKSASAASDALDAVCDALAKPVKRRGGVLLRAAAAGSLADVYPRAALASTREEPVCTMRLGGAKMSLGSEEGGRDGGDAEHAGQRGSRALSPNAGDEEPCEDGAEKSQERRMQQAPNAEWGTGPDAWEGEAEDKLADLPELISVPLWAVRAPAERESASERAKGGGVEPSMQGDEDALKRRETGAEPRVSQSPCDATPSSATTSSIPPPATDGAVLTNAEQGDERGEVEESEQPRARGEAAPEEAEAPSASSDLPEHLQWIATQLATPLENLRGAEEEEKLLREQIASYAFFASSQRPASGQMEAPRRGGSGDDEPRSEGDWASRFLASLRTHTGRQKRDRSGAQGDDVGGSERGRGFGEDDRARRRWESLAGELINILETEKDQKHFRLCEQDQQEHLLFLLRRLQEQQEKEAEESLSASAAPHEKFEVSERYSGLFSTIPESFYESLPSTEPPTGDMLSSFPSSYTSRFSSKRASFSSFASSVSSSASGGLSSGVCTTTASLQTSSSSSSQCTSANAYSPVSSTPTSPLSSSVVSPPPSVLQPLLPSAGTLLSSALLPPSSSASAAPGPGSLELGSARALSTSHGGAADNLASAKGAEAARWKSRSSRLDADGDLRLHSLVAGSSPAGIAGASSSTSAACDPRSGAEGGEQRRVDFAGRGVASSSAASLQGEEGLAASLASPGTLFPTAIQEFLRIQKEELSERERRGTEKDQRSREAYGTARPHEVGGPPYAFSSAGAVYPRAAYQASAEPAVGAAFNPPSDPASSSSGSSFARLAGREARGTGEQMDERAGTPRRLSGRDQFADVSLSASPSFSAFLSTVLSLAQEESARRRANERGGDGEVVAREPRHDRRAEGGGERRQEWSSRARSMTGDIDPWEDETTRRRSANGNGKEAEEGLLFRRLALHLVRLAKREEEERRSRAAYAADACSQALLEGDRRLSASSASAFSGLDAPPHRRLVPASFELRHEDHRRVTPSLSSSLFDSSTSLSAGGRGAEAPNPSLCTPAASSSTLKESATSRSSAPGFGGLSPFVVPTGAGVSPLVGCRGLGGSDCRCGGPEAGCVYRSGVSGVVYDKSGQKWTARWNEDGKQHKRTFAAAKYGFLNAKMRAEACRGEARQRAAARALQAAERNQQRRSDASRGSRGGAAAADRERDRLSLGAGPPERSGSPLELSRGSGTEEEREGPEAAATAHHRARGGSLSGEDLGAAFALTGFAKVEGESEFERKNAPRGSEARAETSHAALQGAAAPSVGGPVKSEEDAPTGASGAREPGNAPKEGAETPERGNHAVEEGAKVGLEQPECLAEAPEQNKAKKEEEPACQQAEGRGEKRRREAEVPYTGDGGDDVLRAKRRAGTHVDDGDWTAAEAQDEEEDA